MLMSYQNRRLKRMLVLTAIGAILLTLLLDEV